MLFYCNRGRENLRELKKTDFSFHGSGDNKYIALRDHEEPYQTRYQQVFFQLALDAAKNNHNQGVAQTNISQMI
jgi:hypothetical protein